MINSGGAGIGIVGGKDSGAACRAFKLPITADDAVIDLRSRRVALRVKDDPAACTLSRHIVVSDGRGSAGGLAVIAGTQRCAIGNRNGFTCQLQTIDDAHICT